MGNHLENTVIHYMSNLIFGLILTIAQNVNNNLVCPSLVQNLPVFFFHATLETTLKNDYSYYIKDSVEEHFCFLFCWVGALQLTR
jgi:hypothetical protein